MRFNPVDVRDIVSNGEKQVIFWNWTEEALTAFHPPRGISKLKKAVGVLTETVFIPYTTKAVTATMNGSVVLWDYPVSELVHSSARDAIKILKLVSKTGINLLTTILDRYVVCGCEDGAVRFFDFQFRVVAWFEDIQAGQVTSVSFAENNAPQSAPSTAGNVTMEEFTVPDFVVSTSEGKIIRLESKMMDQIAEANRRGVLLVQGFDGPVFALDSHPSLPMFAVGTEAGTLQIWDIDDRVISASRKFEPEKEKEKKKKDGDQGDEHKDNSAVLSCLKFSPNGSILAVGFANGTLRLVSSQEAAYTNDLANASPPLRDIRTFKHSTECITDICFSKDGQYLATADADRGVGLFRYYHRDEETDKPVEWIYIGKFRSHYKPITSIYFEVGVPRPISEDQPEPPPRLFSLGEDRILHEYDIDKSSIRAGLKLLTSTKVDQVGIPTAMVSIPGRPVASVDQDDDDDEPAKMVYTPDLIVTANDEYKLKVWDLSSQLPDVEYYADYSNHYEGGGTDANHSHCTGGKNFKVCRKTLLAPTYGGPINRLFVLPRREGSQIVQSQFLVYSTSKKVVGLIKLPLDGNPNKAMALIAHANEISCLVSSFDGKYLITAGGKDRSVNLWSVSTSALEASIALGGHGIEPYMSLIEGGKQGEFYQDMLDYFYYAQLCSQGVNTTEARKVTGLVPVDQVMTEIREI